MYDRTFSKDSLIDDQKIAYSSPKKDFFKGIREAFLIGSSLSSCGRVHIEYGFLTIDCARYR